MFMRRTIIALLLTVATWLQAGVLLDRTVATVNTHVILQSDWDDQVRFEAFLSGRKPEEATFEQRKGALSRLVDQELLREQMHVTQLKAAGADAIKKQIDDLKKDQLREHPGQSWGTTLSRYQLTDRIIEQHVAAELEQFQLIDLRFRPSIQVPASEVEKYYREEIVPKFTASGPLSLNDAAPKIREILIEEKINQLLNAWLETLRSQAQIQVLSEAKLSDLQPSAQGTR